MKNLWKEVILAYFKVLSWHSPAETEENHKKSQSGQQASQPRFKTGNSQIQVTSITVIMGQNVTNLAQN
jgi:hypothetical protein